jgi:hypothetical protein
MDYDKELLANVYLKTPRISRIMSIQEAKRVTNSHQPWSKEESLILPYPLIRFLLCCDVDSRFLAPDLRYRRSDVIETASGSAMAVGINPENTLVIHVQKLCLPFFELLFEWISSNTSCIRTLEIHPGDCDYQIRQKIIRVV